jgi:hypothetical protein
MNMLATYRTIANSKYEMPGITDFVEPKKYKDTTECYLARYTYEGDKKLKCGGLTSTMDMNSKGLASYTSTNKLISPLDTTSNDIVFQFLLMFPPEVRCGGLKVRLLQQKGKVLHLYYGFEITSLIKF